MKHLFTLFLSLAFSISAYAAGLSAHRYPNESYEHAKNRHLFNRNLSLKGHRFEAGMKPLVRHISAERARKPLKNLNLNDIPDVGSYPDLVREFQYVRDSRFLATNDPNFPRRLTWMYPDDGCYARAEVAKHELEKHNFPAPKKVFVFGNLYASSKNSTTGFVQWWYHVAVTYRAGNDVYIFDPALEPQRPLTMTEWNKLVGGEQNEVQYSVCDHNTYEPSWDCYTPAPLDPSITYREQKGFLEYEWQRLLDLQRNPTRELGDFPPWLSRQ